MQPSVNPEDLPTGGETAEPLSRWQMVSDRILAAAVRRMRAEGPRVSMQDVAAEAGVSRGALYRHFAGREAMLEAVLERTVDELLDLAADEVDPAPTLATKVAAGIRFVPESRVEPLETALRSDPGGRTDWLTDRWRAFWVPRLGAARERGEIRVDLDLAETADWIARIQISFLAARRILDSWTDPVELDRYVDEHLIRGLDW